jgi:hypothetical protein
LGQAPHRLTVGWRRFARWFRRCLFKVDLFGYWRRVWLGNRFGLGLRFRLGFRLGLGLRLGFRLWFWFWFRSWRWGVHHDLYPHELLAFRGLDA